MGRESAPVAGRGIGWVVGQLALGALVAVAGVTGPSWSTSIGGVALLAGAVLAGVGVVLFLAGIRALGGSLTPFPAPKDDASLKEGGVYRLVRHPIYGGILLVAVGWSLLTSPVALLPSAMLALLLDRKSRREEAWLLDRYAGYQDYRRRVRWRFVPGIR